MLKAVLVALIVLSVTPSARAFENIEADAAYNGPIKARIAREFAQGLTMLKAQAEHLNMPVREKDISALQRHMYAKARLIGQCTDDVVTAQKKAVRKLDAPRLVDRCVTSHMKFIEGINRKDKSVSTCATLSVDHNAMPPYEFLKLRMRTFGEEDYTALKKCVDSKPYQGLDRKLP